MLKRPKTVRPAVSREEYLLRNMMRAFPGGEWVDSEPEDEAPSEAHDLENSAEAGCDSPPLPPSVALIGGPKYDEQSVQAYLETLPPDTIVYVGAGRGVEADLCRAEDLPVSVQVLQLEPERFGKKARDVNVEQVLIQDLSSPVVLVGAGTRVKQAREWLGRAEWGREVVEL